MRKSDDEIGYCLIDQPPVFKGNQTEKEPIDTKFSGESDLIKDLTDVFRKHGLGNGNTDVMDVSTGKLTLDQINLVFKHLQIDLSYVDENDIVKFYSDTKHRVFPRSAGVIGRKVQNCHPRESLASVQAIIDAFRSGKQDKAEFWIEMGGKFIYIIYNAVRDDRGNFRGVLEMMQDVTHIRSLTGSRKLLTWDNENNTSHDKATAPQNKEDIDYGVNAKTVIAPLLKKYPFLKDFLISLNPKYSNLNNPVVFNTMGNVANLGMIAGRGGFTTEDLIRKIIEEIKRVEKSGSC